MAEKSLSVFPRRLGWPKKRGPWSRPGGKKTLPGRLARKAEPGAAWVPFLEVKEGGRRKEETLRAKGSHRRVGNPVFLAEDKKGRKSRPGPERIFSSL